MKIIDTGKHVIKLYDSVDELPISAYQRYNKFLLIDAGIGSSIDDFDAHIVKLAKLIGNNEREKAVQELQNMRQNLFMINANISPKYLAFAALVYSIDGKKIEAVSDDDYSELLAKIQEIPHSLLTKTLDWLKKKITDELEAYFPGQAITAQEKDYYAQLKQRILLQLDFLANGIDHDDEIQELDAKMFAKYRPSNFDGPKSIEVEYNKQFESTCLIIAQQTNLAPKTLTVLQFYSALEDIKKQIKRDTKHGSRRQLY